MAADVDADGYADVYLVSQVGPNALYRNLHDGTFEDITDSAVALEDKVKSSASFGDLDNDGDPDLLVTSIRSGNALLANDGSGRFSDVTAQSGLAYEGHSSSVEFFDYDEDGLLDVFVTNVGRFTTETVASAPFDQFAPDAGGSVPYFVGAINAFSLQLTPSAAEQSRLYHNEGALAFTDVTEAAGVSTDIWDGDAVPMDGNDDGWTDLYVVNMQGEDVYFENNGHGGFEDKSRQVFERTPFGSTGAAALDVENDGRQDLFVVDMHSDMTENVSPARDELKARRPPASEADPNVARLIPGNALYLKGGPDQYTEAADAYGLETMWPWGLSVGDLNADGYEDLFVTSGMNATWRYHPDNLFLNERGKRFFRAESVLGVEPRTDGVVFQPWFSVDCTTDQDNFVCSGTGLEGPTNVWDRHDAQRKIGPVQLMAL